MEAILNSRPLTALSSCTSDLKALTPNDFLMTGEATVIQGKDYSNQKEQLLKRWEKVGKIRQEYITSLQQRSKWLQVSNNIKEVA